MKVIPHYFAIPGIIKTVGIANGQSHIEEVVKKYCAVLNITMDVLLRSDRMADTIFRKHIAVWCCTKKTKATLHEIARFFSMSHSNVISTRNKVDAWFRLSNDDGREAERLLKRI